MENVFVRFSNESNYVRMQIDLRKFMIDKEYEDVVFGWYKGYYICIKKGEIPSPP
jgi:hypothetical protein